MDFPPSKCSLIEGEGGDVSIFWGGPRNNNSTIKKARLRFFVFLNKKETTQVACFDSHKKGKEPHPAFLHCGIVEAINLFSTYFRFMELAGTGSSQANLTAEPAEAVD